MARSARAPFAGNHADYAVIGAGVVGMATALELRSAGARVLLLERDCSAKEASWAGAGILSPLPPWKYGRDITRLARDSMELYPDWIGRIESESGIDCECRKTGLLVLPPYDAERAIGWLRHEKRSFSVAGESAAAESAPGSLLLEDVRQVRNPRLLSAMRGALRARKVEVMDGAQVASFRVGGSSVEAALLGGGKEISAGAFIVCAGAWSSGLLEGLPHIPRIRPVKGQVLLYRLEKRDLPEHILFKEGSYLVPRRDGHALVGGMLEEAGFDKSVTPSASANLKELAVRLWPACGSLQPLKSWSGLRPASEDGLPIIDAHPRYQNLFLNSGHFRYGLTFAPASASIMRGIIETGGSRASSPFSWVRNGRFD